MFSHRGESIKGKCGSLWPTVLVLYHIRYTCIWKVVNILLSIACNPRLRTRSLIIRPIKSKLRRVQLEKQLCGHKLLLARSVTRQTTYVELELGQEEKEFVGQTLSMHNLRPPRVTTSADLLASVLNLGLFPNSFQSQHCLQPPGKWSETQLSRCKNQQEARCRSIKPILLSSNVDLVSCATTKCVLCLPSTGTHSANIVNKKPSSWTLLNFLSFPHVA